MRQAVLFVILCILSFDAALPFRANLAFWAMGQSPIATVNSSGLGPTLTNDLSSRSVTIGGFAILHYKAIVINSGTCTDPGVAASLAAAPTSVVALPFTFTPDPSTVDTYFTVCVIGQNYVGNWQSASQPTSSATIRINTILPTVTSFQLNSGVSPTETASIPIAYAATHSNLNITHFCLKSRLDSTAPATPLKTDSCWVAVNNPSPGQVPSQNISFTNYNFVLGFSTAEYHVFAWAKSAAGAVSYLSSLGTGTKGVDKDSIQFNQSTPPSIINVLATNTDTPSNPVQKAELQVPAGSTVYIKWNVSDDKPLPSNAISITYTTDEITYSSVQQNLNNGTNSGGCTVDGVTHTGCYRWTNASPTSTYIKFRVSVVDSNGLLAYSSAPPNNTTPFEIIAGNTDPGLNSSAQSAILYPRYVSGASSVATPGGFVVKDDGTVFILDERGLMTINPGDGQYREFIPIVSAYSDGPLNGGAGLRSLPMKIALDYNNGMLIMDYERIRRFDFGTNQLSTLIGGGSTVTDGTAALSFRLDPNPGYQTVMVPLPNGDIWFTTGLSYGMTRNAGARMFFYKSSDAKIYEKIPTGTGSLEDGTFDPSTYVLNNWGIGFDPTTSTVTKIRTRSLVSRPGGHTPYSVSYSPTTMVATGPHVPFLGYWTDDGTITSPLGEMYGVDRFQLHGLFKYDSTGNSWVRLLGTGYKGQCSDGTPALSCDVDLTDAYISAQNIIYFIDRNRIRTIDSSGNVLTLFGQPLSFGDNGLANSARISSVIWLDKTPSGNIVFNDNNEFIMREIAIGGNISRVAGTGRDAVPDTTNPAVSQPITVKYWGGHYPFIINPTTGHIYFTRSGYQISQLDRSTGLWSDIAGDGGTPYDLADGLLGNQISLTGYPTGPNGFDGSKLLWHAHTWNGTEAVNGFVKLYAISNGQQSHLIGKSGTLSNMENCADGTSVNDCVIHSNHHGGFSRSHWDGDNSRWLMHVANTSRVRTVTVGGILGTLVSLPRAIISFTHVVKTAVPHLYYCGTDGRAYKYNLNTSTETALFWPSTTISCTGQSIVWHASRQSVIFPITQNSLGGIAEILDP